MATVTFRLAESLAVTSVVSNEFGRLLFFRVKNDVFQFNMEFDLNDNLKLISQTAYAKDDYYSSQDYNRFVSNPIFSNSDGLFNLLNQPYINATTPTPGPATA